MITSFLNPFLASGALQFAFEKSTLEGKITISCLVVLSLFSWTIILTKAYQIYRAIKVGRKFAAAYASTRDPMDIFRKKQAFDGSPAYEVYASAAEELNHHLNTESVALDGRKRTTRGRFDAVKLTMEEAAGAEAMALEKGMIVLSTAVAGGPFIGLLGTVWGVMETFAGIAKANSASLTAMAPGVAGALIATVIGLLVAIPAMFAYNFMVTYIRRITQELDGFVGRYAAQMEQEYVDNRGMAEEIKEANAELADKIVTAVRGGEVKSRPMAPVLTKLE